MKQEKVKKPFYKKWWFWLIAVVLVIGIIGNLGGNDEKDASEGSSGEEDTKAMNVEISVEPNVNEEDGTVLFGITTNLPENTKLMVTVSNEDGFTAQDTATILNNGTGYTAEFSDHGAGLSGDYTVSVTMSLPSLQDDSVRAVIGEKGENIAGEYVKADNITGEENIVVAEFPFTF